MSMTRKQIFAQEYIIDFNATRAAGDAGYSKKTAHQIGHMLLKDPIVQEMVQAALIDRMETVKINADYVLERLRDIDQLDVIDILDDNGDLLPIRQWPKVWRISISGLEIAALGKQSEMSILKKIKWPDKAKNLDMLGKHIDVNAWNREAESDNKETPPLSISFNVKEQVRDVKVTRGES